MYPQFHDSCCSLIRLKYNCRCSMELRISGYCLRGLRTYPVPFSGSDIGIIAAKTFSPRRNVVVSTRCWESSAKHGDPTPYSRWRWARNTHAVYMPAPTSSTSVTNTVTISVKLSGIVVALSIMWTRRWEMGQRNLDFTALEIISCQTQQRKLRWILQIT